MGLSYCQRETRRGGLNECMGGWARPGPCLHRGCGARTAARPFPGSYIHTTDAEGKDRQECVCIQFARAGQGWARANEESRRMSSYVARTTPMRIILVRWRPSAYPPHRTRSRRARLLIGSRCVVVSRILSCALYPALPELVEITYLYLSCSLLPSLYTATAAEYSLRWQDLHSTRTHRMLTGISPLVVVTGYGPSLPLWRCRPSLWSPTHGQ